MNKIKSIINFLGRPGFITGAADDDPSAIAAFSQSGAQFGYGQLWTALFSIPLLIAIQEMAGRIGVITGRGLAGTMKEHYSRFLLYCCLFLLALANTAFIGADLGAIAASARLLINIPLWILLIITGVLILALEIFLTYRTYSRFLMYLAFSLLAYFLTALVIKQDWAGAVRCTVIPHMSFNREFLFNIAAIIGARASPYMYAWQPSHEAEEETAQNMRGNGAPETGRYIKGMKLTTAAGLVYSGFIMFFIIITTASTIGRHGVRTIETADQAAHALAPLAGEFASLVFAAGIIGAGLLVIPVMAGSVAYALSEAFGWRAGLSKKLPQAWGFYGVIATAMALGLLINLTHIKPFRMLYFAAVLNGFISPFLMVFIMLIANNKKIMGQYTNSRISNISGWIITGLSLAVPAALIASLLQ